MDNNSISKRDLFNIFIITRYNLNECLSININTLMQLFAKYAMNQNYRDIFGSVKITINEDGSRIVDIRDLYLVYVKNGFLTALGNDGEFSITISEEIMEIFKRKYSATKYLCYYEVISSINHELNREDKCELLLQDKVIKIPDYPLFKKKVFKDTHS